MGLKEEFTRIQGRISLDLIDRKHLEGYILRVEDDSIEFVGGGPMADYESVKIKFDDIDLNSLKFYEETNRTWTNVKISR